MKRAEVQDGCLGEGGGTSAINEGRRNEAPRKY
jgi:hypothetical protein